MGYFYSTAENAWAEGSAQMGLAYLQASDRAKAKEVAENLHRIQQEYPQGDGFGLVATYRTKLATGFGESYYPELSNVATCCFYLLEMEYNPLIGKTIDTALKGQYVIDRPARGSSELRWYLGKATSTLWLTVFKKRNQLL